MLRRSPKVTFGVVVVAVMVAAAILAVVVVPFERTKIGAYALDLRPSLEHPLGTDTLGRDILALLLHSLRYSLMIGAMAGSISIALGVLFGVVGGYRGGITDTLFGGFTNFVLVIPSWPLLVLVSSYMRGISPFGIALIIALVSWPWSARTFRAQVMSLKERDFVALARISNLGDTQIALTEVLPNILPFVGVSLANAVSGAMLAEVGISILGLGPQNVVTLGQMLYWAMNKGALLRGLVWWVFPPMLCLILIFLALQMINMGLDEVYNPRLKKITGL